MKQRFVSPTPRICNSRINKLFPKLGVCLIALLSFMFPAATAFGQGSASLSGTITDASQAVIYGAAVVVTNVETGVETKTTSNNSGIYNFQSLQTGTYNLAVEAAGFSRAVRTGIRLGLGTRGSMNVEMAVAGTHTEVEVTGTVETVILEAGSSTGTVLQGDMVQEVPLLSNSVMDLVNIMGGVSLQESVFTSEYQTFAGVNSFQVNITRDGMSVNELRWRSGINANTNVNTEVVGEFKVVLSAVDAEMGRGAGQVQMSTRSGSNAYHGSAVWSAQNTALDSREFEAKRRNTMPFWRNVHNYILTGSGPIIKNKSFFFASWEQNIVLEKQQDNVKVLTPCARKGIYRYISGWVPQNLTDMPNRSTWSRPSVNADGTPLVGSTQILFPGEAQATTVGNGVLHANDLGQLRFESVFGTLTPENRSLLNQQGAGGAYGNCDSLAFNYAPGNDLYGTGTAHGVIANSFAAGQAYRSAYDRTNFVGRFTNGVDYIAGKVIMPPINNWDIGDGLNVGGHRWVNRVKGQGNLYGIGGDPMRKSFTARIDHNINSNHRVGGTYSIEKYHVATAQKQWPEEYGAYGGDVYRGPHNLTVSVTSTIRPTLLNEARFGFMRTEALTRSSLDGPDADKMYSILRELMPTGSGTIFAGTGFQDQTMILGLGTGLMLFHTDPIGTGGGSHPLGSSGPQNIPSTWGGLDDRWTAADTISWMKGAHSFKGGMEYRRQSSYQDYSGLRGLTGTGGLSKEPAVYGGTTNATNIRRVGSLLNATGWTELAPSSQDTTPTPGGNYTNAYALMTYFSGSISQMRQYFYQSENDPNRWNDPSLGEDWYAYKMYNNELHFFFKDDWKFTNNLTLNLGVRYEYYGVPHTWNGRTFRIKGDSLNVFGITPVDRKSTPSPDPEFWNPFFTNRESMYVYSETPPDPVMIYEYVGPGSPNPNRGAFNKDLNNFAPHVGFAWQLPWLKGAGTTLRGGYSINYAQVNNFDWYGTQIADVAAANISYTEVHTGVGSNSDPNDPNYTVNSNYYMDTTDLAKLLPMSPPSTVKPLTVNPVGRYGGSPTVVYENIRNPMVHTANMSLTHNLNRFLTLDVRYIGTLSRKQTLSTSANIVDYIANGLYSEMNTVRNGGESMLLNSLIGPRALTTTANQSGSEQLRRSSSTMAALGRANFQSVASTLATTNGMLPLPNTATNGLVIRSGCLPQDRPGYAAAFNLNPTVNAYNFPCARTTPWNYLSANPQFSGPTIMYNGGMSNYHSMQAQATMRPTRGLNFQATYTWSRQLGNTAWTNYLGERDYVLGSTHRSHVLNTNGSYTLPFGARGFFFRDASGVFKKAIEDWSFSWILGVSSGLPVSVTGQAAMWSDSSPILVRPDLWDNKAGNVTTEWKDNGAYVGGYYFGKKYTNNTLDTNICDQSVMDPALFTAYCRNAAGVIMSSAPRVLALASADGITPALYESDYTAADGVTYKAGTPIVVIRNADQRLGASAAGNFRPSSLTGQGRFSFDLAMSKSIEFMEGKRLEIRVDGQNILNTATPTQTASQFVPSSRFTSINGPNLNINSTTPFGFLTTKGGHRTFQAKLRLSF